MNGLQVILDYPKERCWIGMSWFENWGYKIDEKGILYLDVSGEEEDGTHIKHSFISNNWTIKIIRSSGESK